MSMGRRMFKLFPASPNHVDVESSKSDLRAIHATNHTKIESMSLVGHAGFRTFEMLQVSCNIPVVTLLTKRWVAGVPLTPTAKAPYVLGRCLESIIVEIVEPTHLNARSGPWASDMRQIATKHCHTRTKLGSTERNHVFSGMVH